MGNSLTPEIFESPVAASEDTAEDDSACEDAGEEDEAAEALLSSGELPQAVMNKEMRSMNTRDNEIVLFIFSSDTLLNTLF
jgi:hypothetical protein